MGRQARAMLGDAPMRTNTWVIATGAATLLAAASLMACGSSIPPPNDQWAAAEAEVGRAEAGGAARIPAAKLHLQLAHEDMAKSKSLINNDNGRATTLIEVARVEAQLAFSLAREAAAEDQQRAAQSEVDQANQK
jgi:hypothetical protein